MVMILLRDGSALPSYFIHPETSKATPLPYVDLPTTENSDEETFRFRSLQVCPEIFYDFNLKFKTSLIQK